MPLSLFILYSLFMWSISCNVIPPSPSYSPFRSFYSESSNPLDYLWVLFFLNKITLFLCVCVCVHPTGWMDMALNTRWTVECQRCITFLNFLFSHLTQMREGSLEWYAEEDEKERETERHIGKLSLKHFLTYGSKWPQLSTSCHVHVMSALL